MGKRNRGEILQKTEILLTIFLFIFWSFWNISYCRYAPSVPLTHNFKDGKSNIKDLLVRAKAGMQAGDIQKEAHLSFYLGMVYESNKQYNEVKIW